MRMQFTSFVSIEPPNALLLEIKGSVKLFGSLETAACGHRGMLAPAGACRFCSATAPSTLAALWLARAGDPLRIEDPALLPGHLAKVSIACTAWDNEQLQTLRAMGVTRLGELLRLPRAGLARRLSPALVRDLDIALARQLRAAQSVRAARAFSGTLRFRDGDRACRVFGKGA